MLIGQTQSGKILTDTECRNILAMPVTRIEEQENKPFQADNTKFFEDFEEAGNLDDKVVKDDIIRDYLRSKEGSIAYEVEKIKLLAGRKKSQLQTDLTTLKYVYIPHTHTNK